MVEVTLDARCSPDLTAPLRVLLHCAPGQPSTRCLSVVHTLDYIYAIDFRLTNARQRTKIDFP